MIRQIDLPIYNQEIHLVLGETSIDCCNLINNSHVNEDKIDPIDCKGFFWETNYKYKGILKKRFYLALSKDDSENTTLEHEIIHLSWAILDHVGVKINSNNHEAFTYLFEHLLKSFKSKIKELAIDKNK